MANPLVSIITPARDAAVYLTRAVASVLGQSYGELEHIVVAQDHLDYAAQLRRAGIHDPRVRVIATAQPGESTARALNIGLGIARGSIIAPMAATGIFYANRLERLVPLVETFGAATDNRRIVNEQTRTELGTVMPLDGRMRLLRRRAFLRIMAPLGLVAQHEYFAPGWRTDVGDIHHLIANLSVVAACKKLPMVPQPLHELRLDGQPSEDPYQLLSEAAPWRRCLTTDTGGLGGLGRGPTRMLALHLRRRLELYEQFAQSASADGLQFLRNNGLLVTPGTTNTPDSARASYAA